MKYKKVMFLLAFLSTYAHAAKIIHRASNKNPQKYSYSAISLLNNQIVNLVGMVGDKKVVTTVDMKTKRAKTSLISPEDPSYDSFKATPDSSLPIPLKVKQKDDQLIVYKIDYSPFFGKRLETSIKEIDLPSKDIRFDASVSPDKNHVAVFYQVKENGPFKIVVIE